MPKLLVTGSSGLIGSAVTEHFIDAGWTVHGLDNNQRAVFFGPEGDTRWNQKRLEDTHQGAFRHHELDVRDRDGVLALFKEVRPEAVVHAAAQPSHDRAAAIPFDDFDTNAVGTLNLLEACRQHTPAAPFAHLSTNKVYGDAPNEIALDELETRYDYADPQYADGIPETFRIDQSKHSLFGASKVAADVMVQEYGRYFDMPTCALRGGCLTGAAHSGVELHGFLSYLVRCNVTERPYTVFGYKGKQVRDNIDATDVARFVARFIEAPRAGRGLQPRRRARQLGLDDRGVRARRGALGQADGRGVLGAEPLGRPHLLHLGPLEGARALPRLGHHGRAGPGVRGDLRRLGRAPRRRAVALPRRRVD